MNMPDDLPEWALRDATKLKIDMLEAETSNILPGSDEGQEIIRRRHQWLIATALDDARRAGREELEPTLKAIVPALPVLRAMCLTAKLSAGAAKADEMLRWCQEALGYKSKFPDPPIDALRALPLDEDPTDG